MLGNPVMGTSIEGSRFKSAFGKLEPPAPKRLHPKVLNRREIRKPISFFDSQRIDRNQLYQPQQHDGMLHPDQMIDINDHEARLVQPPHPQQVHNLGDHLQESNEQAQEFMHNQMPEEMNRHPY